MKHQDQHTTLAHNNGHYYYVVNAYVSNAPKLNFTFLHLSNAIKFAKNKTIPCLVFNKDGNIMYDFSKIHEF